MPFGRRSSPYRTTAPALSTKGTAEVLQRSAGQSRVTVSGDSRTTAFPDDSLSRSLTQRRVRKAPGGCSSTHAEPSRTQTALTDFFTGVPANQRASEICDGFDKLTRQRHEGRKRLRAERHKAFRTRVPSGVHMLGFETQNVQGHRKQDDHVRQWFASFRQQLGIGGLTVTFLHETHATPACAHKLVELHARRWGFDPALLDDGGPHWGRARTGEEGS